jgi:hypothetical protein
MADHTAAHTGILQSLSQQPALARKLLLNHQQHVSTHPFAVGSYQSVLARGTAAFNHHIIVVTHFLNKNLIHCFTLFLGLIL